MVKQRSAKDQRRTRTGRFLWLALAAGLSVLAIALLVSGGKDHAARAQGNVLMAIDADTGPSASGIQSCIGSVAANTSVNVDLVIENVSDVAGFGMRLLYDNNIVSVDSRDRIDSILGDAGLDVSDPLPDTSNSYLDGYAGTATTTGGPLTRYTLHTVAAGLTKLHLSVGSVDTNYSDSNFLTHLPDQTQDAFISVGSPCPNAGTDADGDGVADLADKCPNVSDAGQPDRDGDGLGDGCDPVVMTFDTDTGSRKVQNCRGNVTSGSPIDLVIRSADIKSYQLRASYDNSIIAFAGSSTTPSVLGTGGIDAGSSTNSTGRMLHGYTGNAIVLKNDGILMRYTVNAGSNGMTRLALISGPTDSGWVDPGNNFHLADQTPLAFLVVGAPCPAANNDRDNDGITDYNDKCPNISDAGQPDLEGDQIGDGCDADDENDGALDPNDNCPRTANSNQLDTDGDGQAGVQPSAYPNDAFGGNACDAEDDGDGIDDAIDGPGQSLTASNDFNDGTGTTGTVNPRNGLFVRVRDEAGPAGVRINVSGAGGPATLSVCSSAASLSLVAGNEAVVTCGSATVQVVSGPLTMSIGASGFLRGSLPASTTTTVTRSGNSTQICNSNTSTADIVFTGIAIAPAACNLDSDTDGFFDAVETHAGTDANAACGSGAWPPNINHSPDNQANILDIGPLKLAFGSIAGEDAYDPRTDLNADNLVNIADLGIFRRFFGLAC